MHSTLWGQHNDGVLHLAKTVLKISDAIDLILVKVVLSAVEESWASFSPYPGLSLLIHGFYLGHASHATAEDLLKDSDEDGRTQIQPKIFQLHGIKNNNIY